MLSIVMQDTLLMVVTIDCALARCNRRYKMYRYGVLLHLMKIIKWECQNMCETNNLISRAIGTMSGDVSSKRLSESSTDKQILDYIMSNICDRLDVSKMAFSGGYIISKIVRGEIPRSTDNIDISIQDEFYYGQICTVLESIGKDLAVLGVVKSYHVNIDISEKVPGGIRFIKVDGSILSVNVYWSKIERSLVEVNILGFDVNRLSVERMLADKMRPLLCVDSSVRPEDLYDFYIITNCFDVDLVTMRNDMTIFGSVSRDTVYMGKFRNGYVDFISKSIDSGMLSSNTQYPFDIVIDRVISFISSIDGNYVWICKHKMFDERTYRH